MYSGNFHNPAHFVVVARIDPNYVVVFDNAGQRLLVTREEFSRRFSGKVLHFSGAAPPMESDSQVAGIRFKTLHVEMRRPIVLGEVDFEFEFPLENTVRIRSQLRK